MGQAGNKDCCKCGQCKRQIWKTDSLYCTEVPAIIEDKFEGKRNVLELLCLNKTILKNALVGLEETRGDSLESDKDLQNRSLCFGAIYLMDFLAFELRK